MTILSTYNLSSGDTISSVYTFAGTNREIQIQIFATDISGYNSFARIETSTDQTNWTSIEERPIPKGTNTIEIEPKNITGAYVRASIFRNDSHAGTVMITVTEPPEIVQKIISLSSAQIKTAQSSPIIVTSLPAIAGKIANITDVLISFTDNGEAFTNQLHIQCASASKQQWEIPMAGLSTGIYGGTDIRAGVDCLVVNDGIEIHADADSATGNGTADVYITCNYITA